MPSKSSKEAAAVPQNSLLAVIHPVTKFGNDSYRLIQRCTKPSLKEFKKIALATTVGFLIMGFIGFFVKLIHIPINNIIVGN
ncbi:hypothetical protein AAMO2058_000633200 [Amorphochlora amoebiformis]|mmetsp:Transcript_5445/g.8284  ORF Transcript_5445/g.8284 Transcript_5445/m.8284 type:complete len:82 (-) Transcript_5445:338-583(-)